MLSWEVKTYFLKDVDGRELCFGCGLAMCQLFTVILCRCLVRDLYLNVLNNIGLSLEV